ncbi:Synaptobrevin [Operophtera brumata]|uniref:Synaptobrevin n=1 Tax=Operophtera brumata TaxID=104452 RepID=A0A0L7LG38_OPEBR|nr:Synaptobrevin [Operophtera brumata]
MPILFSVVAQKQNIIANFASCDGNFIEITRQFLSKLTSCDDKMTYYHGPYLIHYILEDSNQISIFQICQRSRAFLFLNQIHRRYVAEGKDNFAKVLAAEMYTYSEDYSTITIRKGDRLNKSRAFSFDSVTYVGKTPERISVSEDKYKAYSVVIIGVLLIVASGSLYIFGPVSCIIVLAIIAYCFLTNFKKSDS